MHKNTNDKWVTIIGLTIMLTEQLVGPNGIQVPQKLEDVFGILHAFISITVLWLITLWIIKKIRLRYPSIAESQKRIILTASICVVVMYIFNLITIASNKLIYPEFELAFPPSMLLRFFTGILLMVWIIYGMYEAGYYHHLLRQGQKEKNDLLYLQKHHQLADLKNKVNPHFLFNSLNTLSYLVHKDGEKAEKFVEELSTVYRYLLRNNEEQLATLQSEYNFIQSYIILLQIRFGNGFQTSFTIDPELMLHRLPPLSLQVLVENVVKHNAVSTAQPLQLTVFTENNTLIVQNNRQRKHQVVNTGKTGLNYLLSRYEQIGEGELEIEETESHFTVKLPLLPPSQEEQVIINHPKTSLFYA